MREGRRTCTAVTVYLEREREGSEEAEMRDVVAMAIWQCMQERPAVYCTVHW